MGLFNFGSDDEENTGDESDNKSFFDRVSEIKEEREQKREDNWREEDVYLHNANLDCDPQNSMVDKHEVSKIDNYLRKGESVHFIAKDASKGVEVSTGDRTVSKEAWGHKWVRTVATDNRVLSVIPSGVTDSSDEVSIPYKNISSVDLTDMSVNIADADGLIDMAKSAAAKRLEIATGSKTYWIDVGQLADDSARDMAQFIREQALKTDNEVGEERNSDDPLEKLERLKELKEEGAITKDEFDEKKKDLLDRI
jgi:hypothetical protein